MDWIGMLTTKDCERAISDLKKLSEMLDRYYIFLPPPSPKEWKIVAEPERSAIEDWFRKKKKPLLRYFDWAGVLRYSHISGNTRDVASNAFLFDKFHGTDDLYRSLKYKIDQAVQVYESQNITSGYWLSGSRIPMKIGYWISRPWFWMRGLLWRGLNRIWKGADTTRMNLCVTVISIVVTVVSVVVTLIAISHKPG